METAFLFFDKFMIADPGKRFCDNITQIAALYPRMKK